MLFRSFNITLKYMEVGPERWQKNDFKYSFFEAFYDQDPEAERIFHEELAIILAEGSDV